uniref:Ig-like domain-containing protein n=1 Tax=Oncorhynchus tshawytscha TaxID=74940 RepID=A0AAZ3P1M1_ONCTS
MTLRCSLLTYTGHGTCWSGFSLSWDPKTGTNAQDTQDSSCDITLTVTLQKKDNNRKWTCTLTEKENMKISIDFTSTFSGVSGETLSMFSRVGDDVSLPCNNVIYPNCSSTVWIYNRDGSTGTIEVVTLGKIKVDQTERLSLGSNCSLHVSDVRAEDAGLYICQQYLTKTGPQHGGDAPVDLSVLTISSTTPVTDLKPNVNMTLQCSLLTYTGHGTCWSGFSLSWDPKTGTNAQDTQDSSCDITLTVTLQKKDNNRKWTCTLTEKGNMKISIDFTSTFSDIEEKTTDSDDVISTVPGTSNAVKLPISRIMLFVTLTIMAAIVTIHTRRIRPPKALPPQADEASGIEIHVLEE